MFEALRANMLVRTAYKQLVRSAATLEKAAEHPPGPIRNGLLKRAVQHAYRGEQHAGARLNDAFELAYDGSPNGLWKGLNSASVRSLGVLEGASLADARSAATESLVTLRKVMPGLARAALPGQIGIVGAAGTLVGAGAAMNGLVQAHRTPG